MKTSSEIHEKICELMDKASAARHTDEHEQLCCKIDALLWVIGDESGLPI